MQRTLLCGAKRFVHPGHTVRAASKRLFSVPASSRVGYARASWVCLLTVGMTLCAVAVAVCQIPSCSIEWRSLPLAILILLGYNEPNIIRKKICRLFHKGLNKEALIEASKGLIEENGIAAFSMRALAEKLGVKTASLYAHIENMDALFTEVGLSALRDQKAAQLAAIEGKDGDAAVFALAESYRAFAKAHAALYQLIMQMPMGKDETLRTAAAMTAEPSMQVLQGYAITEERRMHWQRVLRGVMHGFVSQEASGYFSHYPVDLEESYCLAIGCVIDGLHKEAAQHER